MNYDIDFFIRKFSKIPESKWMTRVYELNGKKCALGHCGETFNKKTEQAKALAAIFGKHGLATSIVNDYDMGFGETPKSRIINALKSFKLKEKK